MANNCNNYISIKGNETEIKEFYQLLQLDKTKGQDKGNDIYQNLLSVFGKDGNDSKWFDVDVHEFQENEITISGDTAWAPSLELFTKISEKYQSFVIRYEYDEMGCDFAGYAEIEQGNCNNNCFTYWDGKIKTVDEDSALEEVLSNELECFENVEELQESDMYNAFSEENQKLILEAYKELQTI